MKKIKLNITFFDDTSQERRRKPVLRKPFQIQHVGFYFNVPAAARHQSVIPIINYFLNMHATQYTSYTITFRDDSIMRR